MGGDDLGSDDEFLTAPIRADNNNDDDSSSSDEEQAGMETIESSPMKNSSSKRKNAQVEEDKEDGMPAKNKKRKREKNELRDLGVRVQEESNETQAKLLSQFVGVQFHPHQVATREGKKDHGFESRVTDIISKKQLKKWRVKGSPMIVIVCLSARRAVQVLKDLAPLRIRAAKLFAKHISMEQQKEQMESGSFGFAVGTPHRILTLARDGAVSFAQTRLVVLDTCPNTKNFSVYTLPDTAPHTQALLKEFVYPETSRRKDVRVGFL